MALTSRLPRDINIYALKHYFRKFFGDAETAALMERIHITRELRHDMATIVLSIFYTVNDIRYKLYEYEVNSQEVAERIEREHFVTDEVVTEIVAKIKLLGGTDEP